MKGIVHFLSGVAVATFFPDAVNLAATQSSFILVLGGIGGLLPDTLDFRFTRFFAKPDVDIDPHPASFDAQEIATRIAAAIHRVAETKQKTILQLRTMRLGADLWRQYSLRFDTENHAVIVKLGPVVNTSQQPLPQPDEEECVGHATVSARLMPTYGEETQIDIFGGPSFALEWRNEQVEISFIPWHRQWSHALTLAALFGLGAGILFGPLAGAILALGYAMHIAEDQLGFLGSNLFYPFTRRRTDGLKLLHSGEAVPNFFAVWTALVVILFNLDRFSPQPLIEPLTFFGLAWLPALVLLAIYIYHRRRAEAKPRASLRAMQQAEVVQETREVEV
jgi:membrane-bound metal-dependent hydrolase YbcI (DUF457 family)